MNDAPSQDEQRLRHLVSELFDGALDEVEAAELNAILAGSSKARTQYWEWVEVHAALHQEAEGKPLVLPDPPKRTRTWARTWAVGASVALLLLVVGVWFTKEPPIQPDNSFAEINGLRGVEWNEKSPLTSEVGHRIGPDALWLDSGEMEIRFDSGALLTVTGPASLELEDSMNFVLNAGLAKVYVPESAHGFAVKTEWLNVVDEGTHFSVMVDQEGGVTQTQVFEGQVAVSREGQSLPTRITAGQAISATENRLSTVSDRSAFRLPALSEKHAFVEGLGRRGHVRFDGKVIATWEISFDEIRGFGNEPIATVTTAPHGRFVGIDIDEQATGQWVDDFWEVTLVVTPVADSKIRLGAIEVLGSNPNFPHRILGPARQGKTAPDIITFSGTGFGAGTLSDPISPEAPKGNLRENDGAPVPLVSGVPTKGLSWVNGNAYNKDWTSEYTNWSIRFPVARGASDAPLSLTYRADFAGNVFSEGFGFAFVVE